LVNNRFSLKTPFAQFRRIKMKKLSQITKRLALSAMLACVFALGSSSAFAKSSQSSVNRTSYQGETHTGICCSDWDASVTVKEPETLLPIVVTFSTDYRANAPFFAAISINGGPCTFFGPAFLPAFSPEDGTYSSRTFQWVILPGDYKLVSGKNVLTLCGGGLFNTTDTITLGFNTMSAHLQK
jgi:hypothetical protein